MLLTHAERYLYCREEVKWPSDMDPVFKSFLEGLLQKDPKRRISWPHLLYHPFVSDGRWFCTVCLPFHPSVCPSIHPCIGINLNHLMHCAQEGQLIASSRVSEHSPPDRCADVAVISSILRGEVVWSQQNMSTLDTHLHNSMSRHVGDAELHTTLQAVEVLIQQRQGKVLAGCGVGFWLVDLMENWPQVNSHGENTLGHVVKLLTQTVSILLTCSKGTVHCSHGNDSLMHTCRMEVKGHSGHGSSTLLVILPPCTFTTCTGFGKGNPFLSLCRITCHTHPQLLQPIAAMVVAASNWTTEDHMMLLRCIRDSIDVGVLGVVMDDLDSSLLQIPMGEFLSSRHVSGSHDMSLAHTTCVWLM